MKIRCTKSGRVPAISLNVVALPPKKRKQKGAEGFKVTWRKRDRNGNIIPQHVRKNRSVKPSGSRELPRVEELHEDEIPPAVPNLDQRLQILRDLLSSVTVPASPEVEETPTMSAWTQRQLTAQRRFRAAMPELLNCKLAAETVTKKFCEKCKTADAVVRCLDCVPSGTQFLCPACDSTVHKKHVFHDREAMTDGFFQPIPPTSSVMIDQSGQHQLAEQVCVLPIPLPLQVCTCGTDQDFTIVPGKQTVLVTINEMKLASPALSQQAFLRMLEHRSLSTGRMGSICGDTFHRAFREFAFCNFKKDDLCQVEPFKCPACTPDMLAICADGNRKHYRFKKSKGTDEPSLFDGLFIAQDAKVSAFVDQIRSQMTVTTQRAELEAANLLNLKQELNISQEDTEQWVEDVKQWAATERPGADRSHEELQREIDDMIYSLRRKKHDLYRQNVSSAEITEEGYRGLQCCLLHKRHLLQKKLSTVTSTYALLDASSSFTLPLDEGKEEGEEKEEEESEEDDTSSDEE
ncbi:hypothetical protein D5F01_LYC24086 [Larimichthys crocea]|uniref:Uncharacterized protein n=1 Tax=Larimichthys crocea TaxID=215358 RepID=A0A6G0HF86_LARCR|nr:hypothetical protein D5F01_LYC24086 [Larimichthys crocea]